jgi:hypothetical protein
MQMRIDEAGRDGAAAEFQQMSLRSDQRFKFRELTVRDDLPARDRNRVDPRMPEDETFVPSRKTEAVLLP